ncbi:MAG TPA: AAA family ATPase [Leptospiraceae bacterium]|nr:AAA family ATPase [Leptospiraceae bacterium]HMY31920.1 AAA family ATPase [Leptospiraceae bacterium]HMZ65381.1 AAA family ATPase [Leptospiraceae bacterium]HNA06265.1 AAA family ATPase [Leptospiraceae bacterium]HNC54673.1 AAA family ATPase [Leptospiraceae bacterium]
MQETLDYNRIETIFEGNKYSIFRAEGIDNRNVILKIFNSEHPTQIELNQIENEYKILEKLKKIEGVTQIITRGRFKGKIAFVFKNTKGESLEKLIHKKIPLYTFFKIAKLIVAAIDRIHVQKIIHNDIKPSNIIYDSDTSNLEILNFGSSMEANGDYTLVDISQRLDRDLSYISPEQTGRVNHAIDMKSDYYSLGATLFHLITGRPPFLVKDSIDLIYSHIAKEPISPTKIDPNIPEGLSKIILKLLSKNPEERYHSSYGLLYDLESISSGQIIPEDFQVGQKDFLSDFHIPKKLYGRENEVKQLTEVYYSMYNSGKPELALIQGGAGIGKSALVKGINEIVSDSRGFFVIGEYDQFNQSHAYSGIIKALSHLMQVLLTETEDEINNWRNRIYSQMGTQIFSIVNIIPELELILGSEPPEEIQANEGLSINMQDIFLKFIRIFGTLHHPLVLFLDDVQWADSASITLIQRLIQNQSLGYILIILGFRTSQRLINQSLSSMLDKLKKDKIYPCTIRLKELNLKAITQFLSDSLFSTTDSVKDLADIVLGKTAGNPFFMNEFLKDLSRENLITIDRLQGKWVWDIEKIKKAKVSENIIELLVNQIKKLPILYQSILKTAACIGARFDLWLLSISLDIPFQDLLNYLKRLTEQDFIYLSEPSIQKLKEYSNNIQSTNQAQEIIYCFQHDRVFEAAYSLLDKEQRSTLQLSIGRFMLEGNFSSDTIQDIANHMNAGSEKIENPNEIKRLIELNLEASQKAKNSTAHDVSLEYLKEAQKLLFRFEDPWSEIFNITLEVYKELSELYYLNVLFEEMEETTSIFLKYANNQSELIHGYRVLVNYYTTISNFAKAIEIAKESLNRIDFYFPFQDFSNEREKCLNTVQNFLQNHSPEEILKLPKMESEKSRLVISMLSTLMPAAYMYNIDLWTFLVLKSASIIFQEGICEEVYSLSGLGILLGIMHDDYKTGHQIALIALKIAQGYKNQSEITKAANVLANYTLPFQKHLKEAKEINNICMEVGKNSAELQHLSYSLVFDILNLFYSGVSLNKILNEVIPKNMVLCQHSKSLVGKDSINAIRLIILMMTTSSDDKMEQEVIREYAGRYLLQWKKNQNYSTVYIFKVLRAYFYYLNENYNDAYTQINRAKQYEQYATGMFTQAESVFIESLILCSIASNAKKEERNGYLEKIRKNQIILKKWSKSCPDNFFHKYLLIEGEICRIKGHYFRASKYYDEAIEEAHTNEFIHIEALANEICARLYIKINKSRIMQSYINEAYYLYDRWGAVAKVKLLEEKFPEVFFKANRNTSEKKEVDQLINSIDLDAVIKASQALTEEIVLEKLLEKVMRVLFENAGAEKGLFIRYVEEEFKILAIGNSNQNDIEVVSNQSEKSELSSEIAPKALIHYVARLKKYVVISDARKEDLFINDPYLRKKNPKSILCYPVLRHERLIGLIYLENNYTINAFTKERLEVLAILSSQLAISIENSELYSNLEAKVTERTANLNQALHEVQLLKEKQDADYFLTSLLIHPLGKNKIQNDLIRIEFFIEQKKKFLFKNKQIEIGGDLCTTDRIFLNGRSYIVVLNADAMGKSIQGAGGILVLGSVFKSIIQRTHSSTLNETLHPEKWIKNSFLEMQRVFESFDGYMLISMVLGLLEEETGIFYFINVEHPKLVLYRQKKAKFIKNVGRRFRKMGIEGIELPIQISLFKFLPEDVLILGSDGRDDIILGQDEYGLDILNFDENLFLEFVEEGRGNLKSIYEAIRKKGEVNDDLSLIRVSYKELNASVHSIENPPLQDKKIELSKEIESLRKNRQLGETISLYEQIFYLDPMDTDLLIEFSNLLFQVKNYKKAIEYLEIIKLRYPNKINNLQRLIISNIRLRNFQKADSLLAELLSLDSRNRKARFLENILSDRVIKSV